MQGGDMNRLKDSVSSGQYFNLSSSPVHCPPGKNYGCPEPLSFSTSVFPFGPGSDWCPEQAQTIACTSKAESLHICACILCTSFPAPANSAWHRIKTRMALHAQSYTGPPSSCSLVLPWPVMRVSLFFCSWLYLTSIRPDESKDAKQGGTGSFYFLSKPNLSPLSLEAAHA